ncbi:MAG: transcriptional regulator [Thermomicrobiales bacterium]|nr:transcriptional regulator [Thermomicrobiales bacterium]
MQVNAKVDYGSMKAEAISRAQGIPPKFLENILLELRHAGIVLSQRGAEGGYRLGLALRANMRAVLERVTLEDLVTGNLPPEVVELTEAPDAWSRR